MMSNKRVVTDCRFSFDHYRYILETAKQYNYKILCCYDYYIKQKQNELPERYIILRHDIEHYPDRAVEFANIEAEFGIRSSYFIRVHAKRYNIFNFKAYNNLKQIISLGHEIGLHAEPIDFSATSGEKAEKVFQKELAVLKLILDCEVYGVCPHVDWTEYNNIDFFKDVTIIDFGIKYQSYTSEFFEKNFYISDGQHYYWKNYQNGILLEKRLCPCKIIEEEIPGIYILTHPMNWFNSEYHLM